MDPVKILPTEVFEQILSYFSLKDLMSCCMVSQKWNIAANNDNLWKDLCLQNDWRDCGSLKDQVNCFGFLTSDDKDAFNNMGEWRKHFVLKNQLQINWRLGNVKDFEVCPIGSDFGGNITALTSDGHNILAFGFDNGVVKLFDLKEEGKLVIMKECVLITPVVSIQIFQDYMFVIQSSILEVYKLTDDPDLELYCMKIIKGPLITNIDIPTLLLLERSTRTVILSETSSDEDAIYHFNGDYMIFASAYSPIISGYDLLCDLVEPDFRLNISPDVENSCIFNLHSKDNTLYIVIGEYDNILMLSPYNSMKLMVLAYSLRNNNLLYMQNIAEIGYVFRSRACTIESNDMYLVIRFEFSSYFLIERDTGRVLLDDNGIIFLNANSNTRLVGVLLDDSFHISDPNTGDEYYCITLDGSPLAVYSSVIVTLSVEYNRDCVGSTEIEFWNMYDSSQKIVSLKFPKTSDVNLLFKDDTKLIFYASKDRCVIRSFLV